ncbi:MAG: Chemotaxis response regulator protein-glutamate methylesterase CheB (EC 3.1.1.61) [Olavius algarvensis Gamma 3 endosymbiont]|nr:MAG: Chemotaxis response regulator protein-glutamate methylesterase CheB (EC 3.1.1.61) [Olavius algarvensis Gamma 3 endosymbiont]
MKNIKVMIIDDSAVVRQVLSDIIDRAEGMEVIDTAIDPIFAQQKLQKIKPDVITLDIEMPRMDGLTFLEKLMCENPIPVVMCSKLTQKSAQESLRALHLGAVEVVGKPLVNMKHDLQLQNREIVNAIRVAAGVNRNRLGESVNKAKLSESHEGHREITSSPEAAGAGDTLAQHAARLGIASAKLIAIGASTGGTQALEFALSRLDSDATGVVVVQHMPEAFTGAFAQRLDQISAIRVKEAENGDRIEKGLALIAPGGQQLEVENHAGELRVCVRQGPPVSRHCPSVDVLFRSVAQAAPRETLGIIMTGMGDDGARGMKELFDAGAFTVAQDEASCIVFGMPGRALEQGGVTTTCSLRGMPALMNAFGRPQLIDALKSDSSDAPKPKALAGLADSG